MCVFRRRRKSCTAPSRKAASRRYRFASSGRVKCHSTAGHDEQRMLVELPNTCGHKGAASQLNITGEHAELLNKPKCVFSYLPPQIIANMGANRCQQLQLCLHVSPHKTRGGEAQGHLPVSISHALQLVKARLHGFLEQHLIESAFCAFNGIVHGGFEHLVAVPYGPLFILFLQFTNHLWKGIPVDEQKRQNSAVKGGNV